MSPFEDLFFMTADELLEEMQLMAKVADREAAHRQADQVLVAALRLACSGEVSNAQGAAIINSFEELERWYG